MKRTILLTALAASLFAGAAACAVLAPLERAIEASLACSLESMVPLPGFEFAASCPEQVHQASVSQALSGNPPPDVTLVTTTDSAGGPLASVHKRTSRGRVCIGHGRPRRAKPAPHPEVAAMPYMPDASADAR